MQLIYEFLILLMFYAASQLFSNQSCEAKQNMTTFNGVEDLIKAT